MDNTDNLVLGIDLGGTKVLSAVIDPTGKILGEGKKRTQKASSGDEVFNRVVASANSAMKAAGVSLDQIDAVGVGSPGPLDPQTGVIEVTPNLGFRHFPLKDRLVAALKGPVFIHNDVNIGTFGEWKLGAGVGVRNLVGIFVGTGIGGGLILNGVLYEGANGSAGEIGHMVVDRDGPKCGCGNRGCLEAIASRSGMSRILLKRIKDGAKTSLEGKFAGDPPTVRSKALTEAYLAGDQETRAVLDDAAEALGRAVGSLINLLSPEMIVLGGGVVGSLGADYVESIRMRALKWAFEANARGVQIVAAKLEDHSGVQGAAAYARMKMGVA